MSRGPRAATALLATVLAALAMDCAAAATARADGDPASDVLLVQNVFYPYQPAVSPSLEKALESALASAARASGVHWKVAIIHSAPELGLEPRFFGHAQAYANFLDREISFNTAQSLITVMPSGYGVVPTRYAPAVAQLPVDTREGSDGLTRSAIDAVLAVSRQMGHPIPPPAIRSAQSGSSPGILIFGPLAVVLFAAGLFLLLGGARAPGGAGRGETG